MASVSDKLWQELCASESEERQKVKKRQTTGIITRHNLEAKAQGTKKKGKKKSAKRDSALQHILGTTGLADSKPKKPATGNSAPRPNHPVDEAQEEAPSLALTYDELAPQLQRLVQRSNDPDGMIRLDALKALQSSIGSQLGDTRLSASELAEVFDDLAKPLFRRFEDPIERCREISIRMSAFFLGRVKNLTAHLAYFFPALMRRLPTGVGYDAEIQVFVYNPEEHDAWKRGRALPREDRVDSLNPARGVAVVEPAEELRLATIRMLATLLNGLLERGATPLIHPYFHDVILFTQAQLRDPYPDVKLESCRLLCTLCRNMDLNQGMIMYALALARCGLPVLRHRHARVRVEAVKFVRAAICVPFKAKWRGAGTDAIVDLIGFQAEDTIPIAAFYQGHTTVNYLAELTADPVTAVRLETAHMLAEMLTEIMDRYDHKTRLAPYMLNAVNDDAEEVCVIAMEALAKCGKEYEKENSDEIIERRQYGVDGDRRANHDKPLPPPFSERPRLGTRLYVRGTTRRFIRPLLRELTNWISKTRLQSVRLFRTCIVYCEESFTQDLHTLLPELCAALRAFEQDHETNHSGATTILLECCELLGRFINPDSLIPFLLPRLSGEKEVVPQGVDSNSRALVLRVGSAMLTGARQTELLPHMQGLVDAVTDEEAILTTADPSLQRAALHCLTIIVEAMSGATYAAVQAHFLATGRLSTRDRIIEKAAKALLVFMRGDLGPAARECFTRLAISDDESASRNSDGASLAGFISRRSGRLLEMLTRGEEPLSEQEPDAADVLAFHSLVGLSLELTNLESESTLAPLTCVVNEAARFVEASAATRSGSSSEGDQHEDQARSDPLPWAQDLHAMLLRLATVQPECRALFGSTGSAASPAAPGSDLLERVAHLMWSLGHRSSAARVYDDTGLEADSMTALFSLCRREMKTTPMMGLGTIAPFALFFAERLSKLLEEPLRTGERTRVLGACAQLLECSAPVRLVAFTDARWSPPEQPWSSVADILLPQLVAALDSPTAEIRRCASVAMGSTVHFVVPHTQKEGSVRQFAAFIMSLADPMERSREDTDFCDNLEATLRQAAVLDCFSFLAAIPELETRHGRSQRLCDLVEHGELLRVLSKDRGGGSTGNVEDEPSDCAVEDLELD